MYKSLFTWVILTAIVSIVGCDASVKKPSKVGILLYGDSRQPQVNGFIDGLKELGYEDGKNIRYVVSNAHNNKQSLTSLVDELVSQQVDLLVASGGLEADAIKQVRKQSQIPVVVSYVNAIEERKLVNDRRNPGWPITGIDNLNAELSGKRVELIHDMLPGAKRVLILYYPKIAPSRIGVEHAQQAAAKYGIQIDAHAVSSSEEVQKVMQGLKPGEVDAMLTVPTAPIDNVLQSHILPVVNRLKIPLMTHSRPLAQAGALASYGANFYDLGKQAARLADKVLRGVQAERLPFETPKYYTYTINKQVLSRMSVQLTDLTRSQVNEYINESD